MYQRPGAKSHATLTTIRELKERVEKLDRTSKALDALLDSIIEGGDRGGGHVQGQELVQPEAWQVAVLRQWHGAQTFDSAIIQSLCSHTTDWDMASAMFTIMVQILSRLRPMSELPEARFPHFRQVAAKRDELSASILKVAFFCIV